MCEIGWDSDIEHWSKTRRTARKPHVCQGCKGPIAPGVAYIHESWKMDGAWWSEKCCIACDEAIVEFERAHDGAPVPSYFAECLRGCLSDGDEESERRWRPMLQALEARGAAAQS